MTALFLTGGAEGPVDTEDVAVRAAELAPGMFSWRSYPDFIDKELVRRALADARLKKGWVIGSHNNGGWILTTAGVTTARRLSQSEITDNGHRHRSGRDDRQFERERNRLVGSDGFRRFQAGEEPNTDEADAFFRINVYVEGEAREKKIARIENLFGDDPELSEVVTVLARTARGGN